MTAVPEPLCKCGHAKARHRKKRGQDWWLQCRWQYERSNGRCHCGMYRPAVPAQTGSNPTNHTPEENPVTAVPVRIQVIRFACPFCFRSRAKAGATAEHMLRCWKSPANRTCKTCVHYQAPSTGPSCEPGHDCSCSDWDEACTLDGGPEPDVFPVVACPLWEGRPGYPAMEPTVVPCRECAAPLDKPQQGGMCPGQWLCDGCAAPVSVGGQPF